MTARRYPNWEMAMSELNEFQKECEEKIISLAVGVPTMKLPPLTIQTPSKEKQATPLASTARVFLIAPNFLPKN